MSPSQRNLLIITDCSILPHIRVSEFVKCRRISIQCIGLQLWVRISTVFHNVNNKLISNMVIPCQKYLTHSMNLEE